MDALILLVAFLVFMFIGIPVAYAMGLATLVTALWIDIPLEAVMLKISDGVSKVAMLTIPFFVLAGAIMAEGGMAKRLVAFANVLVGMVRVRGGSPIFSPDIVNMLTSVQSPPNVAVRRAGGFDLDSSYSKPRGEMFPIGS